MSTILEAIRFTQKRQSMFITTMTPAVLEQLQIDIWNPKSVVGRRGYQRVPDLDRIAKIAKFLEGRDAIMPIAGLLNIRDRDVARVKFSDGRLIIPDDVKVWVVDMQHRLKAIVEAKDNGAIRNANFQFPVVITAGLNQLQEATQFYVINTRAKKMDVALTRRLLIENNLISQISDVKAWESLAVQTTIFLNRNLKDSPWYQVIREPNSERLAIHIATEKSFVSSLRNIFYRGKNKQFKKTAKRLGAFWRAIQINIPTAFDEPKRNLIQKTPGMFAFNYFIAPRFLKKYKDRQFEKALAGLKKLDAKFWLRKNKTGARKFGTGMGGYANLATHIEKHL